MSNAPSWKIFIPTNTGFEFIDNIPGDGSINSITDYFGYERIQLYTFWNDYKEEDDFRFVALELFSRNIAYVAAKSHINEIDKTKLYEFLLNLQEREIYESYTVEDKLNDGIKYNLLTAEFLAKSLELDDISDNGIFYAEKLGMYLYFTNGLLTDYQGADGLGIWAKTWKQVRPDLLESYQLNAERYWGNNHKAVLNEINTQATAWASIPQAMGNTFVDLHRNEFGIVNLEMLLVCHYDKKITLQEFLIINHGRCQLISKESDNIYLYKAGYFSCGFDKKENLVSVSVFGF